MKKIYAISYKNEMYSIDTRLKEFDSLKDFELWRDKEEDDFRTREEISQSDYYDLKKWLKNIWC